MNDKNIQKIQNQINSLRDTELQNLRSRDRYEKGIIRAVSPQGDNLFLLIQRLPHEEFNKDKDIIEVVDGEYFGNEQGLSEEEITLTELLIEADVNLSIIKYDPSHWIGKDALVWMVNKRPIRAMIQSPLLDPRAISAENIKLARVHSPERKLNSPGPIEFLRTLGYSREQVSATIEETFSDTEPKGYVLRYGDSATWHDAVAASNNESKNLESSLEDGIVTNLYGGSLDDSECFLPVKAITAR